MSDVIIYSTTVCPYCRMAKALLDAKKISYDEILVDERADLRDMLIEKTGLRTVPQIFIHGTPIGGYDRLIELSETGQLEQLINIGHRDE